MKCWKTSISFDVCSNSMANKSGRESAILFSGLEDLYIKLLCWRLQSSRKYWYIPRSVNIFENLVGMCSSPSFKHFPEYTSTHFLCVLFIVGPAAVLCL